MGIGNLGKVCGLDIVISEHCGTTTIEFTRKQTRKFTNTRWVKKYLKKHSFKKFQPGMIQTHDKIIMHPLLHEKMINEIERAPNPAPIIISPPSLFDMSRSC